MFSAHREAADQLLDAVPRHVRAVPVVEKTVGGVVPTVPREEEEEGGGGLGEEGGGRGQHIELLSI